LFIVVVDTFLLLILQDDLDGQVTETGGKQEIVAEAKRGADDAESSIYEGESYARSGSKERSKSSLDTSQPPPSHISNNTIETTDTISTQLDSEAANSKQNISNIGKINEIMECLFRSLAQELQAMVEWGDKMDHFYCLDMLIFTKRHRKEQTRYFVSRWRSVAVKFFSLIQFFGRCELLFLTLSELEAHLRQLFNKFIDGESAWVAGSKV